MTIVQDPVIDNSKVLVIADDGTVVVIDVNKDLDAALQTKGK